jgi:hypothetical protein
MKNVMHVTHFEPQVVKSGNQQTKLVIQKEKPRLLAETGFGLTD